MKRKSILLFLSLFLIQSVLLADETLSLNQSIKLALTHSFKLHAGDRRVEAAQAFYHQNRSDYFPTISGEASRQQLFYDQYNYRQLTAGIIFDWATGKWLTNSAIAERLEISVQSSDREQIRLDVIRRVSLLYFEILQNKIELQLLKSNIELLLQHEQITQALWQAGIRTQLDLLQTRSAIQQRHQDQLSLLARQENLRRELEQLLGLPEGSQPELLDMPVTFPFGEKLPTLTELLETALQKNPAIQKMQLNEQVQQMRLREINASLLPHLQFSGGFIADADPMAEGNFFQVNVGLQIPLFQWGKSSYQKEQINALSLALRSEISAIKRDIQIVLEQMVNTMHRLQQESEIQIDRLAISRKALKLAEVNYKAGLIENLTFLAAQKDVSDSELKMQSIHLQQYLQLIEIYILINKTEDTIITAGLHFHILQFETYILIIFFFYLINDTLIFTLYKQFYFLFSYMITKIQLIINFMIINTNQFITSL